MSEQNNAVSVELPEWVDEVADRFEQAWRNVAPPRLADFVGELPDEARDALEDELREIDRIYRQRIGERRHPQDAVPMPSGATPPDIPRNDTIGSLPRPLLPEPLPSPYPEVPGYEILDELGQGGMGVVYRARQTALKRTVALKMLHTGTDSSPRRIERFRVESAAAAGLQHPNLVQVHEVGEHDGRPYFVMEYVDGGNLAQQLAGTPLPPRQAAALVETLARAMHYAHEHGVIHRDLKPANVMLTDGMVPKITDFGMAKQLEGESSQTQSGEILGTPSYMAPEQARGQIKLIGPGSDVYGLGAILYELLTGRAPFKGASMLDTLDLVRNEDPIAPRDLQPKVPRDVETICLKCLAKAPARRYLTALELAEELRRFQDGAPIAARPVSWAARLWRWCRRKPLAATLIATVVLLFVVAGMSWKAKLQRNLEAETADLEAETAELRRILEAATRAEVEVRAVLSQAQLRIRMPTRGRREGAQSFLNGLVKPRSLLVANEKRDRLDLEARSVFATTLGVPEVSYENSPRLPSVWYQDWPVALHPDGKEMVIGTHLGPIRWIRGSKLEVLKDLDPEQPRPQLGYDPNGQYVAFAPADKGGLFLYTRDVTRMMGEWKSQSRIIAFGFPSDSKGVWVCSNDRHVRKLSIPRLEVSLEWQLEKQDGVPTAAAFSMDGSRLAVGTKAGKVRVYDATGKLLQTLSPASVAVQAVAWSPDNQLIATTTRDGSTRLWESDTGVPSYRFHSSMAASKRLLFTPDSRWLLAGGSGHEFKVWDTVTGQQLLAGPFNPMSFSRDGRTFAAGATDVVAFYDLSAPQVVRQLTGHHAIVERLSWSQDSRHIVTLDASYAGRVWNVEQARTIDAFRHDVGGFAASNAAVALNADASQVAYASGGPKESFVILWEIKTPKELGKWKLPGGFERLAFTSDNKLLSVREELDDKMVTCRSVVRELVPGKPAGTGREFRASEPRERFFLDHMLTPDGRYYMWLGPRYPSDPQRVEVREVATGRLVTRIPGLKSAPGEPSALLSPDGLHLTVSPPYKHWLYDLTNTKERQALPTNLRAFSPKSDWLLLQYTPDDGLRPGPRFALRRWGQDRDWLEFDASETQPASPSFSPDGRYLAWGNFSGAITVVDLPALEEEVGEFEKAVLGK